MKVRLKLFDRWLTIDITYRSDEESLRKEWHKNGVWVTKEGQKIPVERMSNLHLINVLSMLEKKAEVLSRSVWSYPEPQGEMAQDAYYAACDEEDMYGIPSKEEVLSRFAIYPHIVKELKRRGL